MARLRPQLIPAGEPERRLYEAATAKYKPLELFFAAVAKHSGNEPESEKGAFFRYLRGSSIPDDRLVIYATLLGEDVSVFTRLPPPEPEWMAELRQQLEDGVARFLEVLAKLEEEIAPAPPTRKRPGRSR